MKSSWKILPTPQKALPPKTDATKQISLLYAGLLTVMAVAQLFTFETFIELIPSYDLPIGEGFKVALPALIVAAEVFALPFLLRMALSPAFRWFSMFCGWFVALAWFLISIWIVTMNPGVLTIGFLGTAVDLLPGWWAVLISFSFGILAAWSAWGLWPGYSMKKS